MLHFYLFKNVYSFSLLYILFLCPSVSNVYNNNRSIFFSHITIRYPASNGDIKKYNFTQGWLNSYCLPSALSYPFIAQHDHTNERSRSIRFLFSSSLELYRAYALVYLSIPHLCCYWFICKMFDVFVSVYFLFCIHIASCCVRFYAFAFCISIMLMVFVFVAFAYFHVNVKRY